MTQKITPFLWYDGKVEEAMNFYLSVFKNSKVVNVNRMPDGTVFSAIFELDGQTFFALNGGPMYQFTPAVSFFVSCDTQEEVDEYWDKLAAEGTPQRCGWIADKYGLCWQIIPTALMRLMGDPNPVKAQNVMNAMLQMVKIDIAGLQKAYDEA